MMMHGLANVKQ